ncbi:MAG TPA: beta/gamma crystallin-related protein [Usitatibacteraceae bacterium]|nr:beta/gamma crystallin-related protein [Usitatibacteraceae bacterium]
MNKFTKCAAAVAIATVCSQAVAQVVFYEHDDYYGRSFSTPRAINNLAEQGFNDRASSAVVMNGRWEVCEDEQFRGRCMILRPGRYSALSAMGLNDRISSVREISNNARYDDERYAPPAERVYDNRRRRNERLYEAEVTSVRAVVGRSEERCWVEREQVDQDRGRANVGGAVVGALIGGVLGHQVGSGRGNDVATAGGAIAGAVVGSNVGRGDSRSEYSRDVQRCSTTQSGNRPAYWDVTYDFRGQEHRVQMTSPPGSTITVNRQGEPRA